MNAIKRQGSFGRLAMINVLVLFDYNTSPKLSCLHFLGWPACTENIIVPVSEKAYSEILPDQDYAYLIYREKKQLETRYFPLYGLAAQTVFGKNADRQ